MGVGMMPGIVLQFSGFDSLVSSIISYGTQGHFNIDGQHVRIGHVDAVMPPGHPQAGDLLGAQLQALGGKPSGVWIRPADYGASCGMINPVRVTIPCTRGQADTFYSFIEGQVGKPYDITGLIDNFILDRDWHNPDAWWCSELQGEGLGHAGIFPRPIIAESCKLAPPLLLVLCSAFGDVQLVKTPIDAVG